ncbi:MAG: DUF3108 domain-containing protein [Porticoccaceae bacterium]
MINARLTAFDYRPWLATALLLLALNVQGETAFEPYTATYKASFNGIPVVITQTLTTTPAGYRVATAAANALGEIHEQEDFHVADGAILIDAYRHQRSFLGSKRDEQLAIDRGQGIARYQRDGEPREIPLQAGYLGPVSYKVQLRRDLIAGKTSFEYQVMDRGKIKHYAFQSEGTDTIPTATGNLDAVRVRRVRDDNERQTLFWMAPALGYQLVKLRQEEGGDSYELLLTELAVPPIAAANTAPAIQ